MKQWSREIEINTPIEHVWSYLDGSLEQMQKIMPQVVENKEGKRIEEYDVQFATDKVVVKFLEKVKKVVELEVQ